MNGTNIKGRGAQFNPENPFLKHHSGCIHIEGIDEPASDLERAGRTVVYFEHPKDIISRNDSPDIPFKYSINPYQGCEHGCVYCYARNVHQYWGFSAGMDWESKIIAKVNAPALLEKRFLSTSWRPEAIVLSGNTDPYQPIERKLKITRRLLEMFVKYRNPVSIISKSDLILRDIDLLEILAKERLVKVFLSVTTVDDKLRRLLEPRSTRAERLFRCIEKLSEKGVPVGVMFGPVIPSINDHEMHSVLENAAAAGAVSAGYSVARFNGPVADIFRDWLVKSYPDRAEKVWNKVLSLHGGRVNDSRWEVRIQGEGKYAAFIRMMFEKARDKFFEGKSFPEFDTKRFRRGGNLNIF